MSLQRAFTAIVAAATRRGRSNAPRFFPSTEGDFVDLKKFIERGQSAQGDVDRILSEAEVKAIAAENRRSVDKDSIYFSKERWRVIPQRTGPLSIQFLVIDTYENEIVGTHAKMSEAMAQRDALDPPAP